MSFSNIKLSVIISTYNSEEFIESKINDLIQQTVFSSTEIIIIDSGSKENEHDIIQPFLVKYANIKYIRTEERETIYAAFNRGIRLARGRYITNSNTDDRLKSDAFEIMMGVLDADSTLGLVYADQYVSFVKNEDFEAVPKDNPSVRPDFNRLRFLMLYFLGSQAMWRADVHTKYNFWFNEEFEIAGDYYFALLIAEKYRIKRIEACLGVYYKSKDGLNKEFLNMEQTIQETALVRDFFSQRFFSQISLGEKMRLQFVFFIFTLLPERLYRLFMHLRNLINPRNPLLHYDMAFYFLSIILEQKGRKDQALAICRKYKAKNPSSFISLRIKSLSADVKEIL